jgi:hypothetical protein
MLGSRIRPWIAIALALPLVVPQHASAVATNNSCLVWAAKYTLVEQSSFAVVFSKPNPHVNSAAPTYYACVFSREKAYTLPGQGEGATLSGFQLDGRYVGYAKAFHDPAVAESSGRLFVFDAKQGKTQVNEPAWPDQPSAPTDERGFSDSVTSFVIKANGSAAWIGEMDAGGGSRTFSVQKLEAAGSGKQELDRGSAIGAQSLAKARDELTIYWTNGAIARKAALN